MEDSTYAPLEAARILKLSRRRVQQLLEAGELEGYKDEAGRWFAYQWSVHELRSKRPNKEKLPERRDWLEEARAPMEKVEALQRELGRFEGRLELEAVARSTLEEQLKREQERADREREWAEQERLERQAAQEEVKQLRERLEEVHKPRYLRWFRRSRSS